MPKMRVFIRCQWWVFHTSMRTLHLIFTSIMLVGVVLGIAGCQRDMSAAEYVQRMDRAAKGIDPAVRSLGTTGVATSDPDRIDDTAAALDRTVRSLRAIDPPSRIVRAHQQLERGAASLAQSMHTLAAELRKTTSDQQRLDLIEAWINTGTGATALQRIDDALMRLDRAGYDITTPRHPASTRSS